MHTYGGPLSTPELTKLIHARRVSVQELNQRFVPDPHIMECFTEISSRLKMQKVGTGRQSHRHYLAESAHVSNTDTVPLRNELTFFVCAPLKHS